MRAVLAVTFLLASGIPLAVFWLWPHSSALDNKVAEVHERHLLLARNLGQAMELYHRDVTVLFETFAPEIAEGRGEVARGMFENLHFSGVCVAQRASGRVISSYMAEAAPCPDQVPGDLLGMLNAMSEGEGASLSGVMKPEGAEPRIYIVKRLGEQIVFGAIRTDFFIKIQKSISFGRLGHAAIVDQHGRVLAHPLDEWAAAARDLSKVSAVQRMLAGESGVETFYSPALKGDMIAGFTSVEGPGWGVMVPQPVVELEEVADKINRDALLVFAIGLALSAAIAFFVSASISNRIKRLQRATARMAAGDTNVRVEAPPTFWRIRELSTLKAGFNTMSEQLELARAELIAQSYRSGHADMAASTLHNLRNAMNPLINRVAEAQALLSHAPGAKLTLALDQLSEESVAPERREKLLRYCLLSASEIDTWRMRLGKSLDIASGQFRRIKEMLVAQEQYANEPPVITGVNLQNLVEEALNLVPIDRRDAVDVRIEPSVAQCADVQASRLLLLQVIQNLLTNAIEAIEAADDPERREIVIECAPDFDENTEDETAMTRIVVRDTGSGIENGDLDAIFNSGFTTKSGGQGGLGLHWCATTVSRMNGRVFAESEGRGKGASLNVVLPNVA
ncbi:MAG: ATP-binding protein [Pseudomonadota bacterium]